MTHYPGGKKRTGEEIAEEIYYTSVDYEEKTGRTIKGYCEPFCGMLGVYRHVPILFEEGEDEDGPLRSSHSKLKYLASDRDPSIICMWKAAQKGWKPPTSCSEEKFNKLKSTKNKFTPEKAFLGRAAAYKNTYFGTYSPQNNISIQAKHVKEISENLYDVKFSSGEYTQFSKLKDFIIYCDPPYRNTQHPYYLEGKISSSFDEKKFDAWCRKMSKNNLVLISEFSMPKGFTKIWSKGKEKLYMIKK